MAAPTDYRALGRVVVAVIVVGNGNRKAFIQVADIFIAQRIRRIFGMARNIKLTSAARHRHINARLLALRKKRQLRHLPDIFATYFGMTAVRHIKLIIEPSEYRQIRLTQRMPEHTEHLCRQIIFRHTIEMIQSRLRRPTDI